VWKPSLSFLEDLSCSFSGRIHLSIRGQRDARGRFDWQEACLDASIISGMTFFSGLGALAAAHAINLDGLIVLLCLTGGEFLSVLAAKRKLTPPAK
jgi:hypothetical protein